MDDTEKPKLHSLILCAALLASGFVTHASAQVQVSYLIDLNRKTVTELGDLGGGNTIAAALNNVGQVVGTSVTTAGATHAFVTGPNGVGMEDLTILGRPYSSALGINDAGQVVGQSSPSEPTSPSGAVFHAFITGPNGAGMRDLDTFGEKGSSVAFSINNIGQVVGYSSASLSGTPTRAFITGPGGVGKTDLGTLGGVYSYASGINEVGQVAGSSSTLSSGGDGHAFITGPDGVYMRDLGTLGGSFSYASGINEDGQVVGYSSTSSSQGASHAFITGPDGVGMRDLGNLGGSYSLAWSINENGQVVGDSQTPEDPYAHAFITGTNGMGMTDLNSLVNLPKGGILIHASDINNIGQVVAIAIIPEPKIYAMLLAGLALVGCMSQRRKIIQRPSLGSGARPYVCADS